MSQWYCDVLGAWVVFGDSLVRFLAYDEEHHRLALIARPHGAITSDADHATQFYHVAFAYRTLGSLVATYERLLDRRIVPWRLINHGPTISFYYRDPDCNNVELQVDRFATAEQATQWMQGIAFSENPFGIQLDPRQFCAAFHAGVNEQELFTRPDE